MELVDRLIASGYLKTPRIINAFRDVRRVDFLSGQILGAYAEGQRLEDLAKIDDALPIGYGQTISQPAVVAFMLELLDPIPGETILDVGYGSGWTTALLAHIVSQGNAPGTVIAIEAIPGLKKFGEQNIAKYNFIKSGVARCFLGDGSLGFEKEAPFDKILASASAKDAPAAWKEQLKINGAIVSPIGHSIWKIEKIAASEFKETEYPGFIFVPLVSK